MRVDFDDYTVASAQLYKNKGAWKPAGTIPEPGWQIFFKNSSRICHTGLVVEYSPVTKKVVTIEGNTSSAVGVVANGGCVREKAIQLMIRASQDMVSRHTGIRSSSRLTG